MSTTKADGLNVIALVSGGKDSFFSLLHCRANGHRIVALANLHPALPQQQELGPPNDTSHPPAATISVAAASAAVSAPALESTIPGSGPDQDGSAPAILPVHEGGPPGNEVVPGADEDERDLNSFMYQTVGHQVIPLYAEATGIPLYRRAITGGATQSGKEYSHYRHPTASRAGGDAGSDGHRGGRTDGLESKSGGGEERPGPEHDQESGNPATSLPGASAGQDSSHVSGDEDLDETESMVPLLQAIKKAHPEANAICAGAILSTYQRTRVESVATRLGLTPLAYLWKFPVLPPVSNPSDPTAVGFDAQLLDDMAAAGMEARIIKVASGGLDDSFLWTDVAGPGAKGRLARAMRRFGAAETGAVIGEGGEFETLVLNGPKTLFRKRIVVHEKDRRVVREGGGSAWLSLRKARLEEKEERAGDGVGSVRIPDLLDPKFAGVLDTLSSPESGDSPQLREDTKDESCPPLGNLQAFTSEKLQQWSFIGGKSGSIEADTRAIVEQIRRRLRQHSLPPSAIINATVILRHMADFPTVNSIYGTLFDAPNPPSRVTISCGDALSASADADIAIYLTVHTALPPAQRHGLHVQSRSYWAPANIGPYSQAMSIPVSSLASNNNNNNSNSDAAAFSGPRLVSIAGQIPLVPATMALPVGSSQGQDTLPLQLALSLQHLWRIGVEMGVQWWSSAVAFFPACNDGDGRMEMKRKARLASRAWRAAHVAKTASGDDEEEEDETGPDLWDRRYNPEYMTFSSGGGGDGGKAEPVLPDRDVLVSSSSDSDSQAAVISKSRIPPVFVAEVEELPRAAGVEWHAHWGVAYAGEGSVVLREVRLPFDGDGEMGEAVVSQVVVRDGGEKGVRFVQTVVAEGYDGRWNGADSCNRVAKAALEQLSGVESIGEPTVLVRYVDAEALKEADERVVQEGLGPVVPCRSLWDGQGQRLAALTVYQSVLEEGSK